ncbi:uncharacterized protein BJ212DRAFT_1303987 [Suillus subaureus]|uniref:Secreted protein n=1 Tax=Suillus subaureus TaxID=48587 RepID=A0A9P7DX24_9AGAM|nr:uncharacterized protein BJ212DRAFT_1303987 [Suillus subaureus]KAG1805523.1 hypothetical protein BJ212DRAFT_1303987 [Suillus subaureus]
MWMWMWIWIWIWICSSDQTSSEIRVELVRQETICSACRISYWYQFGFTSGRNKGAVAGNCNGTIESAVKKQMKETYVHVITSLGANGTNCVCKRRREEFT